jgi:hypothetical protein
MVWFTSPAKEVLNVVCEAESPIKVVLDLDTELALQSDPRSIC